MCEFMLQVNKSIIVSVTSRLHIFDYPKYADISFITRGLKLEDNVDSCDQ